MISHQETQPRFILRRQLSLFGGFQDTRAYSNFARGDPKLRALHSLRENLILLANKPDTVAGFSAPVSANKSRSGLPRRTPALTIIPVVRVQAMVFEFGALLRVYRTHWGLTQKEMAELLCISQPVYSRIEAGKKPLSLRALQRVADRSGLSIQTLIFAHLLLDEHLESLKGQRADPATKALLQIADAFRQRYPSQLRDAAALGLLFESASD